MPLQQLCLVRHGEAAPSDQDPERHLSTRGRAQVRWAAKPLGELDLRVDAVFHSGKPRASETAEILAEVVDSAQGVSQREGLNPNDPVDTLLGELEAEGLERVMLVGHLPFMERLIAFLLLGDPDRRVVRFGEAAVAALRRTPEGWEVSWMVQPTARG